MMQSKLKSEKQSSGSKSSKRNVRNGGIKKRTIQKITTTSNHTAKKVIGSSLEGSEIVIGLVVAVGTDYDRAITLIEDCLRAFNYDLKSTSISESVIPSIFKYLDFKAPQKKKPTEFDRIKGLMDGGDDARRLFKDEAILSYGAASDINLLRKDVEKKSSRSWPGYAKNTAFIIKTLKRPEEVALLRRIYGSGFYLMGIYSEESKRISRLKNKGLTEEQAINLSKRDADGKTKYGQRASDTYHLADFFLHFGDSNEYLKGSIERIFNLLFGHPNLTPVFDEFAMFMAFAASLRSADLSRQVGAVIGKNEEILASGANDSPRKGGGLYWSKYDKKSGSYYGEDSNGTDFSRGFDSNTREKNKIINEIVSELSKKGIKKNTAEDILRKSQLDDITEYGRSVHAEMEALLQCARNNISTKGATLYCTTFPCHNCAKHIVAAGIERVVYVEPYPKSKALKLHEDSIQDKLNGSSNKVVFEPFAGVGPRRFFDLFSMRLGLGSPLDRKKKNGDVVEWKKNEAEPRITLSPSGYIELEKIALNDFKIKKNKLEKKIGKKLEKANRKDFKLK